MADMSGDPGAADAPLAPNRIKGFIHSVETGGTVDGPGVRFVLFVSGCPLRCLYCHNPDTWHLRDGQYVTAQQILDELGGYARFLKKAHGGLTISGGEPLGQPEFTHAIFKGAKAMGLHTALDTSGYLGSKADDAYLADVDLVLLDIKHIDGAIHRDLTGVDAAPTLAFARRLAAMGKPMWIRYVLVPGWSDQPDAIERLADTVAGLSSVEKVEVLPFHKMGEFKWAERALPYRLENTPPPTHAAAEAARTAFRARGLTVD
jgi:pyruvate formate lyase activating enzyme